MLQQERHLQRVAQPGAPRQGGGRHLRQPTPQHQARHGFQGTVAGY